MTTSLFAPVRISSTDDIKIEFFPTTVSVQASDGSQIPLWASTCGRVALKYPQTCSEDNGLRDIGGIAPDGTAYEGVWPNQEDASDADAALYWQAVTEVHGNLFERFPGEFWRVLARASFKDLTQEKAVPGQEWHFAGGQWLLLEVPADRRQTASDTYEVIMAQEGHASFWAIERHGADLPSGRSYSGVYFTGTRAECEEFVRTTPCARGCLLP